MRLASGQKVDYRYSGRGEGLTVTHSAPLVEWILPTLVDMDLRLQMTLIRSLAGLHESKGITFIYFTNKISLLDASGEKSPESWEQKAGHKCPSHYEAQAEFFKQQRSVLHQALPVRSSILSAHHAVQLQVVKC